MERFPITKLIKDRHLSLMLNLFIKFTFDFLFDAGVLVECDS